MAAVDRVTASRPEQSEPTPSNMYSRFAMPMENVSAGEVGSPHS
eukprot:CAMPEP_0115851640 /NCGR_PEP_ID=MMETSP0287-20121206/12586_1 /TAXON_ID=412157 /ORGANISM="Chrysochromulina rotalis, Strain UIO044" /LENGTH=43 /DNA_ID= /DNA_START= /DNA_END= /DNA_ORIENTATION=